MGFRGGLVLRVAELHITSRLLGSVKTGRTERGRGKTDGGEEGWWEGRMVRGRGRKDGKRRGGRMVGEEGGRMVRGRGRKNCEGKGDGGEMERKWRGN